MSLSPEATKLYEYLPPDCSKLGGITLQRELEISKVEYQKARDELKEQGLVVSGAGRGGSLGRVEGKEPEQEIEVTKADRMEHAREAKAAMSRVKRETNELRERIVEHCHEEGYPNVRIEDVSFYEIDRPIIMVWDETHKSAQAHTIDQLAYDKLRARKAR